MKALGPKPALQLAVALALAAAGCPLVAHADAQSEIMARVWASRGVPARCLIEVARTTSDAASLVREEARGAARAKATALASLIYERATVAADLERDVERHLRERKDLFDNGLISSAEWAKDQEEAASLHRTAVNGFVETLRDYPSCDFYRLAPSSRAFTEAQALIRAEQPRGENARPDQTPE